MRQATAVEDILRRYGQEMTVCAGPEGPETPVRAMLQPIRANRREEEQVLPTPLGRRREDRFLYLGQAEVPLKAGTGAFLRWREEQYAVQSAQPIYLGKELSHWWAVLVPMDEEGT